MKEMNLNRQFFKYILQSITGMLGISIYILADTYFISVSDGANGLAVLNLILPMYGLVYALGAMVGIGSATRFSIKKASEENTEDYFFQSIFIICLFAVPFILLGIFAPGQTLKLLGADEVLCTLGYDYMRIMLIGAPAFMLNFSFTAFARNDNAPTIAMVGALVGSGFNILFDYIFIFPLGMGMTGAALATALSPVVTMSICLFHYLGKNNQVGFRKCAPRWSHMRECFALGFSSFVGEISSGIITIVFNFLILDLIGNTGVAAYGVVANVSLVVMCIFNGLAQGAQPLISRYYGEENQKVVNHLRRLSLGFVVTAEIIVVAFIWMVTDGIIRVFNSEGDALLKAYAHDGMRLYFLGFLVAGINIMLISYYAATEQTKASVIGSTLRGIVGIIICVVVMAKLFGINGIWLSLLVSDVITLIVMLFLSYNIRRKNRIIHRRDEQC